MRRIMLDNRLILSTDEYCCSRFSIRTRPNRVICYDPNGLSSYELSQCNSRQLVMMIGITVPILVEVSINTYVHMEIEVINMALSLPLGRLNLGK